MNLEFLLLIGDYFKILDRRDLLLEWGMSALVAFILFVFGGVADNISELAKSIAGNSIGLLGILVGFSIAVITLLVTANTPNIDEMKKKMTKYKIGNKVLSLFQTQLINYTYCVVFEILIVVANLILICAYPSIKNATVLNLINSINCFFIIHVLLVTVKNISSFYFVLMRPERE